MGLAVSMDDDGSLRLDCALAGNSNQHNTAFAGSLNAVATLAGWGQLWLILKERGIEAQIVLQSSVIEYFSPVTEDFAVKCDRPEGAALDRLIQTLMRKGRARQELSAEVSESGRRAMLFVGRYVATVINQNRHAT